MAKSYATTLEITVQNLRHEREELLVALERFSNIGLTSTNRATGEVGIHSELEHALTEAHRVATTIRDRIQRTGW